VLLIPVNFQILPVNLRGMFWYCVMPKGNPNPVCPPGFKRKQFKRMDGTTDPLAEKILAVRVPIAIDTMVRALPNKAAWLRRVITEAAKRELMGGENDPSATR
jgi:hypothetical protein